MGKKSSTSAITPAVDPATTKRARAVTEIDDIFASKKSKPTTSAAIVPESVKSKKGKGKGVSGVVEKGGENKAEVVGKVDKKGKGKETASTSAALDVVDSEAEEEEEEDEEAEEWALLEAEEQAKIDAAELHNQSKKRVVQEVIDPSTAIDAFRNTAGPPTMGKGSAKGEGKGNEGEERFMDSRGTARESCASASFMIAVPMTG